jgi:hypothetical protein
LLKKLKNTKRKIVSSIRKEKIALLTFSTKHVDEISQIRIEKLQTIDILEIYCPHVFAADEIIIILFSIIA